MVAGHSSEGSLHRQNQSLFLTVVPGHEFVLQPGGSGGIFCGEVFVNYWFKFLERLRTDTDGDLKTKRMGSFGHRFERYGCICGIEESANRNPAGLDPTGKIGDAHVIRLKLLANVVSQNALELDRSLLGGFFGRTHHPQLGTILVQVKRRLELTKQEAAPRRLEGP